MKKIICLIAVALAGAAPLRAADSLPQGFTETTGKQILVETAGVGEELTPAVEEAGKKAVTLNDLAASEQEIAALMEQAKKLIADVGEPVVSVAADAEFADFIEKHPREKVRRGAWALQKLYFLRAFLLAEKGEIQPALNAVDELLQLAPYSSDGYCERGYLLNMLRRPEEALGSYAQALELANNFANERHNTAAAWRGQGFSFTSLGKYEDAKNAYQQSLKYEPRNKIAADALSSIAQLEKKK
ncbi:hypothetical protein FACS1894139_00290 [Planctomycetales bacterium]|nr:hypothetical protein FACS1894107_01160 [Planctomycetales bacterium]GHT02345.1 hypothetical protein FACS1894139_00290 [Planctomycetales bacterium]GHV19019.1 hypothetical protein AGMMS49959_02560 [Planctomycetales bacterium]